MSVQVEEVQAPILTHADRCDKCNARAYVLAIITWSGGNGELYFCRHDWLKNKAAISHLVAVLIDETDQLTKHATDDGGPR